MPRAFLAVVLCVLVVGVAGLLVTSMAVAPRDAKMEDVTYVIPGGFSVDLRSGGTASAGVAVLLSHEDRIVDDVQQDGVGLPPSRGVLRQQARMRAVVEDVLTHSSSRQLRDPGARRGVLRRIRLGLAAKAQVQARRVFFTDLVVH